MDTARLIGMKTQGTGRDGARIDPPESGRIASTVAAALASELEAARRRVASDVSRAAFREPWRLLDQFGRPLAGESLAPSGLFAVMAAERIHRGETFARMAYAAGLTREQFARLWNPPRFVGAHEVEA